MADEGRETSGEMPEQLLTVAEVAGVLRVSDMTVYRLINRGELRALRIGSSYRIRRGDLDSYLRTSETGVAGEAEQDSG